MSHVGQGLVYLRRISESGQGGWKTQGGGKYTVNSAKKPSPKTCLDPPPTIRFPPPLFWRLPVISLKRKRHRPDQPQFLRPPKSGFGEHTPQYVFPPPKCMRYVLPPPSAAAQVFQELSVAIRGDKQASGTTIAQNSNNLPTFCHFCLLLVIHFSFLERESSAIFCLYPLAPSYCEVGVLLSLQKHSKKQSDTK